MGSILSSLPTIDKPSFSLVISVVSGSIFYFADRLGDTATKTIHLGAFSTWLGTQFWVSFVAGVVMFNTLPRQMFGLVQSKLFPKYFMAGVGLSSVNLASFLALNPRQMWTGNAKTEAMLLSSTLAFNIMSFLVIEPLTTAQMFKCHRYEKEHGEKGQEVGKPLSEALKDDPEYMALRKQFYKFHGVSSLLNMTSFGLSCAYLWYLQKRINL